MISRPKSVRRSRFRVINPLVQPEEAFARQARKGTREVLRILCSRTAIAHYP